MECMSKGYRFFRTISIILILAVILTFIFGLGFLAGNKVTTKVCAGKIVTAIEMVVACQQVGNVSNEQIKEQFIKTFILNKSLGDYNAVA